ncbi:MAG: GerMN domain-containing protein [Deltaproteobacteria bacterium]
MTTKRQRRSEDVKEKKKKKSTKVLYLSMIIGGIVILLFLFFIILINAFIGSPQWQRVFPEVDADALKIKEKQVAIIWFSDQQELLLVGEKRYIFKENDAAAQAKEVVKALLDGSKEKKVNTFPAGVSVLDVKIDDAGIAYVNFSGNLIKLHPGSSSTEMASINSLTSSLTQNIPEIKKVKILVEGKELTSIKGHISTSKAFLPNPDLLVSMKEEKS